MGSKASPPFPSHFSIIIAKTPPFIPLQNSHISGQLYGCSEIRKFWRGFFAANTVIF